MATQSIYCPYQFTSRQFTIYLYILILEQIHIYVTSNTYENTEESFVAISGNNAAIDKI